MEKLPLNEDRKEITPEFLAYQVHLPRDQWSLEFKNYINGIVQENIRVREGEWTEAERDVSQEAKEQSTYTRYLNGLRLSEDELRDKIILDLGSGDGEFVKYCIDKGITQNAYGVEARLASEDNSAEETPFEKITIDERYKNNFFAQSYGEELPVHNVDYVLSMASVTNMDWNGEEWEGVVKVLENSLAALNENGEIRLWPIQEPAEATSVEMGSEVNDMWRERINEFAGDHDLQWELRPTNVIVTGSDNDHIYLNSVLIFLKGKS